MSNETTSLRLQQIQRAIEAQFVGQKELVKLVLASFLSGGHVLIEGVPGLGKTLLVRSLAQTFSGKFQRIQFTPDLMPTDVTGHALYNMGKQQFEIRRGPVFTNLLLADEINRAPAKTQAALLEVMQESQVTIEGKAIETPKPFMVLATQNPIEQEGTYPLPEAELDRFVMKVMVDYPSLDEENNLVAMQTNPKTEKQAAEQVLSLEELIAIQEQVNNVLADQAIIDYAVRLVRATRSFGHLSRGAGPRASIALIKVAKSIAVLEGRDFLTPSDIKAIFKPVLRHRVQLSAEMEIEGVSVDDMLAQIETQVEAPRQ